MAGQPGSVMWGRFSLMLVALTGLGYGVMKITTPSEEEFYNKLSPELKKRVDEARAARSASEGMRQQLQSAQSGAKDQIVWGDSVGIEKPSGRRV